MYKYLRVCLSVDETHHVSIFKVGAVRDFKYKICTYVYSEVALIHSIIENNFFIFFIFLPTSIYIFYLAFGRRA